jgi:hypothetical protein
MFGEPASRVISDRKSTFGWSLQWLAVFLLSGRALAAPQEASTEAARVSFNADIRPIFAKHCVACHGGVKQASELSFVYRDNVLAGGESGAPAVVPGDVDASYLIERVTDPDPETRMPPAEHGPPLSDVETNTLKQWIAQGAKWEQPWAFVAPRPSPLPHLKQFEWCRQPLDHYVLARLEAAGLTPSPPTERVEWLRRVSFDLIGLPPSLADVDAFLNDQQPGAHERVVDRLLASRYFGERWASMWLDLARYADTTGYEADPHRDIWPYRDWLIRAFNDDMPYDQFTIKQLAGDLLESPTVDDRLATAFHRNSQTNTEGGTDDEEYRIAAVIDRVNTTWQVWQATTFGCVQCHSHPYDPIRHEEYYAFMAMFDNTRDADLDEDLPRHNVPLDRRDDDRASRIARRISQLKAEVHDSVMPLAEDMRRWRNLQIDRAVSTGNTKLQIRQLDDENSGRVSEAYVDGAVTIHSTYTIESPAPAGMEHIAALRIDALVQNDESARRIPQMGFVLSQLKATILPAGGGAPVELSFKHAFCDESEPLFDPSDSLNDDAWGWASYTRQGQSQFAVFLLDSPVAVRPGSRIRLELKQAKSTSAEVALAIRRGRFWVSSDDEWTRLLQSEKFITAVRKIARLKNRAKRIPSVSVPVMQELAANKQRSTFVFTRGLWLDKEKEVSPGTPAILPPLPGVGRTILSVDPTAETDKIARPTPNRLDMAKWLVSKENPLTSRVMVNRVWAQLFGTGIVETEEDFGTSGTLPSNPELLDHLALRFQNEHGWSLKRLLRELVLSSTYRQRARITPDRMAADPQNRLLSHGPRMRLTAEMIRDQALVLSGLFAPKMYGPPVMPPQPEGIWQSVYSDAKWVNATGEDRYRRAIYTYWKRTSGYPVMLTFDVPSREVCTMRRIPTNTPLQALVTLNDEAFVECAAGLANIMVAEGGDIPSKQIAWAYRAATGRAPSDATLEDLTLLYDTAHKSFMAENNGTEPEAQSTEHAVLTVVASAILNLDEALTK